MNAAFFFDPRIWKKRQNIGLRAPPWAIVGTSVALASSFRILTHKLTGVAGFGGLWGAAEQRIAYASRLGDGRKGPAGINRLGAIKRGWKVERGTHGHACTWTWPSLTGDLWYKLLPKLCPLPFWQPVYFRRKRILFPYYVHFHRFPSIQPRMTEKFVARGK